LNAMKLRTRILFQFIIVGLVVSIVISAVLPSVIRQRSLDTVTEDSINQLKHIDYLLTNFIDEVEKDVLQLSRNEIIRTNDDSNYTSFLNATGENFSYSTNATEQAIIGILRGYQNTHLYVNSVYMGRENGAFLRAYPRASPTQYDPRERSWYIIAMEKPGRVVLTDPYQSLTTTDLNIGIEVTVQNMNNTVCGVIGADITLNSLTEYITTFGIVGSNNMLLVDRNEVILAAANESSLFNNVSVLLGTKSTELMSQDQGVLDVGNSYLIFYSSPLLGWKIGSFVEHGLIDQEINNYVRENLLIILMALALLGSIIIISLEYTTVRPISKLTDVSRKIADTGDLSQEIEVKSKDEIGIMGQSFKSMVATLEEEKQAREQAMRELERYRDHLEELVAARTRELGVAKDAAESADRIKSAFLATMSHELRTPLNSIIGFTGILLPEMAGPLNEEQTKQMTMVSVSSEHLLALINDVLDISKIEAGQLQLSINEFNLPASIRKIVGTVTPIAVRKGISIEINISPEVGKIIGDSRRVEQILLNLLSNGIKFTEKGAVRLECEAQADMIVIRVIDTGIGISQVNMDKLFKPFSQVDSGLTRQYEGTGLGLSICKKLTDLMGGNISVSSEIGIGSVFMVKIPKVAQNREIQ
jgi:signal transduction histidine kinase